MLPCSNDAGASMSLFTSDKQGFWRMVICLQFHQITDVQHPLLHVRGSHASMFEVSLQHHRLDYCRGLISVSAVSPFDKPFFVMDMEDVGDGQQRLNDYGLDGVVDGRQRLNILANLQKSNDQTGKWEKLEFYVRHSLRKDGFLLSERQIVMLSHHRSFHSGHFCRYWRFVDVVHFVQN